MRKAAVAAVVLAVVTIHSATTDAQNQGASAEPVSGRAVTQDAIKPADVLARVELVRAELELIRKARGVQPAAPLGVHVEGAAPREVLFQARSLWQRTDDLAFETLRTRGELPAALDPKTVRPFHVFRSVNSTLAHVREVKDELGITAAVDEKPVPDSTTPSEVLAAIVEANRETNRLVTRKTEPRDVYRVVSQAIHYSIRLLAQFPEARRISPQPPFEAGRKPSDVHARLLEALGALKAIGRTSDVNVATLRVSNPDEVNPSDVYDAASLVLAELAHFHSLTSSRSSVTPAFDPGEKQPAHVYQRVGLLMVQLRELKRWIDKDPKWLKR